MNLLINNSFKRFLLFICITWMIPSGAHAAGNYDLVFKSGRITTTLNAEQFIADPALQSNEIFNDQYFRIVQFNAIPTTNQRQALELAGIKLTSYFPNYAYLAIFNQSADRSALRAAGARSVLVYQPVWKMHHSLVSGIFPEHATPDPKHIDLVVRYYKTLDGTKVSEALLGSGYTVIRRYDYGSWIEIRILQTQVNEVASLPFVNGLEPVAPPSTPDDEKARSLHRSSTINTYSPMGRHYDGTGVSAALADDGPVGPHIDYQGRIDQTNTTTNSGSHGDMTSGILMGAGNLNPTIRGMGTGAFIYIYDIGGYNHILNSPSLNQNQGVLVTSTSYSQGCNEYTTDTQTGDQILNQNPTLLHVYSAGNNGGGNCNYGAGAGWGNITGGYKQGKNVIACGNLNYIDALEASSSRGPSEDGRIKPDICANGIDQMSTNGPNTYQVGGGTSAACPGIAGIVTQLHQAYRDLNSGQTAEGALIKACMLNTAEDLGNAGPDFKFGWGRVNAFRAVKTLEDVRYVGDSIIQGATNNHTINVPANVKQLRVMIYWCDVEGDPLAAKALVNDLNMVVTDPSSATFDPWVLNPAPNVTALNSVAIRGVDDLNNMEQVTIDDPAAGVYNIDINGFLIPQGPQKYYLVYEFVNDEINVTYPIGYEGFVPGESETIRWDAYGTSGPFTIEYSTDLGANWTVLSSNVPAAQRYYNWTVPAIVTGEALIRVSRGVVTGQSPEQFTIIGLPTNITVDWACPDSIRLIWNNVTGATGYEISQLGTMYMDSVAYSTTNSVILTGIDPTLSYWFSVKAYTPINSKGRRANAIYKGPGVVSCPIAIDASVTELVSPASTLQDCQNLTNGIITIDVENKGMNQISNIPVFYSVNNAPPVSETINVTLNSFTSTVYNFVTTYDFSVLGVYEVKVWTDYVADGNHYNDTIMQTIEVVTGLLETLPYAENFETFINCATVTNCELTQCGLVNGWINQTNIDVDDIDWRVSEGPTPSANTGPDFDHNPGTATGNYIYLEASACFLKEAVVLSPCFDLTSSTAPEMQFWYHMSGVDMGELHVDVYANDMWTNDVIPVLSGNQGNQWEQAVVNLSPFAGGIINIRFRGITGNDYTSDMAIDDINILEVNAPPLTNFIASSTNICVGETITLTDLSLNSPNTWNWSINPSSGFTYVNNTSATSQNPQVQFTVLGTYDVSLTTSNAFGSDSVTVLSYITVGSGAVVPLLQTFQGGNFPPINWDIDNPDNAATWAAAGPMPGSGGTPTIAAYMNNYTYNSAGQEDGLVTERVNLSNMIAPVVTFDVAYARYSSAFQDALRVDISTDCGVTYIPTGYYKQGLALATVGDQTGLWTPSNATQWRNDTIDLTGYIGNEVMLKFVNITGYGNSLYLDNINFDESSTGISEIEGNDFDIAVFPNPGNGWFQLQMNSGISTGVVLRVFDLKGSKLMDKNLRLNTGMNNSSIDLSGYEKGVYLLEVHTTRHVKTIKLVVM